MIAILLCSTIGISLDMHFCQGNIKSIGFYTDANECGMYQEHSQCAMDESEQISRIPCCSDSYTFFQNQIVEKQTTIIKIIPVSIDLASNINQIEFYNFNPNSDIQNTSWLRSPPLIVLDRTILHRNLLI